MNERTQAVATLTIGAALVLSCSWLGQSVTGLVGLPAELWQGAFLGVGFVTAIAGSYMLVTIVRRR